MSNQALSRWIATGIMVLVCASGMYLDQTLRGQMGREAFLAKQSVRYDKFFVKPPPGRDLFGGFFVGGAFVGIYELAAFGVLMLLDRLDHSDLGQ